MTLLQTYEQLSKEIEEKELVINNYIKVAHNNNWIVGESIYKYLSESEYFAYCNLRIVISELKAPLSQFLKDCKEQLEFLESFLVNFTGSYFERNQIQIRILELKQILEKNGK